MPTPRAVTLAASQVIIPPELFPLSGYKVSQDEAIGTRGWRRAFDPLAAIGAEYWFLVVELYIVPDSLAADVYYEDRARCTVDLGGTYAGKKATTAAKATAPITGDASAACALAFAGGQSEFMYAARTRNVIVWVDVAPQLGRSQTVALDQAVSIARAQFAIVDRVAPPYAAAIVSPMPSATFGLPAATSASTSARPSPPVVPPTAASTPVSTPATSLLIYGMVTDAATVQPVDRACITLGPPIRCFTTTDSDGKYVINLSELAASSGTQWRMYVLRNTPEPKYAQVDSGSFVVSGVVQKDLKLSKVVATPSPAPTVAPVRQVQVLESGYGRGSSGGIAYGLRLLNLRAVR